jgi:tRNA (cytidine/uridine-2'-O-)-methyltransferase
MFNIVLFQPEIPPNTGNIIRLCANTGCRLHLVAPLGFALEDKKLRRAGLDYHEWADVVVHDSLDEALQQTAGQLYALSTRGQTAYSQALFKPGDTLVFGPETRGLPATFLDTLDSKQTLRLPMLASSRSLNLSNTVAVVVYEALRQQDFSGLN